MADRSRYTSDRQGHEHAQHNVAIGGKQFRGGEFTPKGNGGNVSAQPVAAPAQAPPPVGPAMTPFTAPPSRAPDPRRAAAEMRQFDSDSRNIDISWSAKRAARTIEETTGIPTSPADVAAMCGAGDNSDVTIRGRETRHGKCFEVQVHHDDYTLLRSIHVEDPSEGKGLYIENEHFSVHGNKKGKGIGLERFASQVMAARALGVSHIETSTAGDYSSFENGEIGGGHTGYYAWPRMGYDADIDPQYAKTLPDELSHCTRLSDLMGTGMGRNWWKKYGGTQDMEFDLADDSTSMNVLSSYLREKGKQPKDNVGGIVRYTATVVGGGNVSTTTPEKTTDKLSIRSKLIRYMNQNKM